MSQPSVLFYTCANRPYEDFIALYILGALKNVPAARVEVGVEDAARYAAQNPALLAALQAGFGDRFLLRDVPWSTPQGQRILPNSVRFVTPPLLRADYVYIGDVDIVHLEGIFPSRHLEFMARKGLPYANSLRKGRRRLSGLHFTAWDAMYPLPPHDDLLHADMNDEDLLTALCVRKGLPLQGDEWWRPVPGIHYSPNRKPASALTAQGSAEHASWNMTHWLPAWREFRAASDVAPVLALFTGRMAEVVATIDEAAQADLQERMARQAAKAAAARSAKAEAAAAKAAASAAKATAATQPAVAAHASRDRTPPADDDAQAGPAFAGAFRMLLRQHARNDEESLAGPASSRAMTADLLPQLAALLQRHGIASVNDAGCADCHWIAPLAATLQYAGFDILPRMLKAAARRNGALHLTLLDVTADVLPPADLVLCRDLLDYLPADLALGALLRFRRSGARWLLATTWPDVQANGDTEAGTWRPLNLQLPPFSLPAPDELMVERPQAEPDPRDGRKCLGLWSLDLPG